MDKLLLSVRDLQNKITEENDAGIKLTNKNQIS